LVAWFRRGLETDDSIVAKNREILAKKLEGYERVLAKSKYLAGQELTLADMFHLPYGTQAVRVSPSSSSPAAGLKLDIQEKLWLMKTLHNSWRLHRG